jgi:hypothetical protein
MIVATGTRSFSPNRSRYQRDISRKVLGSATGELIIGLRNFASSRWKLRNTALSTDVDKAESNSNFRLLALGQGSAQVQE